MALAIASQTERTRHTKLSGTHCIGTESLRSSSNESRSSMSTQGVESKRPRVRRQNSQSPWACIKGQPSHFSSSSSTTNLDEPSTIQVDGNDLCRTDYFEYLGSIISADGNLAHEIVARVNAAWLKWRSMIGVLYDKDIPDRVKPKVYRAVVRSVWHCMVQNAGQPPRN
ncbi:hypothetical protein Y032_0823g2541 [Ancylostoma ceylanicum]|uniref:Uncharacterized protein n=1 Tax=Ancylostoma ceylanicum TaxID=53326 RepID=A0A016WCX6_9BILA|nr:hypothetical protein Y032_0823g2541 [Ancylostoma ceylanicum]